MTHVFTATAARPLRPLFRAMGVTLSILKASAIWMHLAGRQSAAWDIPIPVLFRR